MWTVLKLQINGSSSYQIRQTKYRKPRKYNKQLAEFTVHVNQLGLCSFLVSFWSLIASGLTSLAFTQKWFHNDSSRGLFIREYDPTIEDAYSGRCEYIWKGICDQWTREGEAFMLVYSINSRISFDEVIVYRD
eukprot:9596_1